METDPGASAWFSDQDTWRDALLALRGIALGVGLAESLKWRHPCYTDGDKNIAIIGVRREGAILSLLKGALIEDPRGQLIQPGQDRSVRYRIFTSAAQVTDERGALEGLLAAAVAAERAGLRPAPLPDAIDYVDELRDRMCMDPAFREAFEALTPGRRRGYNLHFAKAKRASTRAARVDRCAPRILAGKGLLDCTCGRTKRPPGCDGSHRA